MKLFLGEGAWFFDGIGGWYWGVVLMTTVEIGGRFTV
jgi:hypothetical protein